MPPYLNYEWEMELVVCASVRFYNLNITGSKKPGASKGNEATFKCICKYGPNLLVHENELAQLKNQVYIHGPQFLVYIYELDKT